MLYDRCSVQEGRAKDSAPPPGIVVASPLYVGGGEVLSLQANCTQRGNNSVCLRRLWKWGDGQLSVLAGKCSGDLGGVGGKICAGGLILTTVY